MVHVVYIDDILVIGSSSVLIDTIIVDLHLHFTLKDLGILHYFLGMEVTCNVTGIHLSQHKFIKKLLDMASLLDTKHVATPMSFEKLLSKVDVHILADSSEYRRLVRSLQYLT